MNKRKIYVTAFLGFFLLSVLVQPSKSAYGAYLVTKITNNTASLSGNILTIEWKYGGVDDHDYGTFYPNLTNAYVMLFDLSINVSRSFNPKPELSSIYSTLIHVTNVQSNTLVSKLVIDLTSNITALGIDALSLDIVIRFHIEYYEYIWTKSNTEVINLTWTNVALIVGIILAMIGSIVGVFLTYTKVYRPRKKRKVEIQECLSRANWDDPKCTKYMSEIEKTIERNKTN